MLPLRIPPDDTTGPPVFPVTVAGRATVDGLPMPTLIVPVRPPALLLDRAAGARGRVGVLPDADAVEAVHPALDGPGVPLVAFRENQDDLTPHRLPSGLEGAVSWKPADRGPGSGTAVR